jgi:hypothetical protein
VRERFSGLSSMEAPASRMVSRLRNVGVIVTKVFLLQR